MDKRTRISLLCIFLGFYLIGVLGFYLLPTNITRTYNEYATTDDGVQMCYDVFEPVNQQEGLKKGVILGHGVMVNKEMLRLVAIDLASHGFVVVAFDFRGHGRSSGQLSFETSDGMPNLVYELRAMKAYLAKRGDIDMHSLGYLGYSMGGGPGFYELFYDNDFRAFVGMAATPDFMRTNLTNPQNLLYIVGKYDEAMDFSTVYKVMENKTGVPAEKIENNKLYGSFSDGTAAKLYIDPYTDHMFAPYDSNFIREIRNWYILALNPDQGIDDNVDLFWLQWVLIGCATIAGLCFFFFLSGPLLYKITQGTKETSHPQREDPSNLPHLMSLRKIAEDLTPKEIITAYLKYVLLLSYPSMAFLLPLAFAPLVMAIALLAFLFGPSMATFFLIRKWLHQRQFRMRDVLKSNLRCVDWRQALLGLGLGFVFYFICVLSIGNILGIVPGVIKWAYFPLFLVIHCFTLINYIMLFYILIESHQIRQKRTDASVYLEFIKLVLMKAVLLIGIFVLLLLIPCVLLNNYFLMMIAIPTTPLLFGSLLLLSLYHYKCHGRLFLGALVVSVLITMVVLTFSPYMSIFGLF